MYNTILDNLEYEPGQLTFKDVRYMLVRPDTVVDFQKAVEAVVGREKCAGMMMAGGYTGGSRSAARYKEVFGYSDEEIVAFMCRMGGEIGWGVFRCEELDVAVGKLTVVVENSPFAAAYGPAEAGVCHMIRGVLAGLGAGIFGGDVGSEETDCVAKGDNACRFAIYRLKQP